MRDFDRGQTAIFTQQNYFDIILGWSGWNGNKYIDDIDLCVFYKNADNTTGGVFNRSYKGNKETEGFLNCFPYVCYIGEERPNNKYNDEEIVRISKINTLTELYIVAIDYFAAVNEQEPFSLPLFLDIEYEGMLPFLSINVNRKESETGPICLIASIKKDTNDNILVTNETKFYTVKKALESIPGFTQICNC